MLRGIGRFIPKWWLPMLGVPTLAAFGYLSLILWFAAHQRDFQYTPGGIRVAPETVGLDGFAAVEIPTEDGERIVAWWAAPPSGEALFCSCTALRQRWRIPSGGCPILGRAGLG